MPPQTLQVKNWILLLENMQPQGIGPILLTQYTFESTNQPTLPEDVYRLFMFAYCGMNHPHIEIYSRGIGDFLTTKNCQPNNPQTNRNHTSNVRKAASYSP